MQQVSLNGGVWCALGFWAASFSDASRWPDAIPADDLYYDVVPQDAFARLVKADIIGFRDGRQCGMLIYFAPAVDDDHRIVSWTVTSGGKTVARFGLHVIPRGNGSVVELQVPRGPNGREIYDGTQNYAHPAILQPLRPALVELVNAAIDQRPYDWHRITALGPDYTVCSSTRTNFEASGVPYRIDDPSGMTHEQAQSLRGNGAFLQVEQDHVFAGEGS